MSQQPAPDTFLIRADQLLTMPEAPPELAAYEPDADLMARDAAITGLIKDAGLLVQRGEVAWFGPWDARPEAARHKRMPTMHVGVCTPGWVECHTHSVFAGERAHEFMLRNAGRSYLSLLEAGGGILRTVEATRQASLEALTASLVERAYEFVRRGVTTLEVKTGYGLSLKDEIKCLEAIRDAQAEVPCELVPCLLAAHAIPPEHRHDRARYVALVCHEIIPEVAQRGLAASCDVFCDQGAFTLAEAEQILRAAKAAGLGLRIHADEIAHLGAARMAAELGATSADHLEHTPPEHLRVMAQHQTVGVLMPIVNLFLGTTGHLAPARQLLQAGGELALSTDFNPGSAMSQDLGLVLNLACTLYKLTPGEALRGVTLGAAKALGRADLGRIRLGQRAHLTLLDSPHMAHIPYFVGHNAVAGVIRDGQFVYWTEAEAFE